MTQKKLLIALLIMFLVGSTYHIGMAASRSWNGSVGGVTVRAEKDIYFNPYTWSADLSSWAAQNITLIGYTYWTLAEYCIDEQPPRYAYWYQYGGGYNTYDDSYYTGAVIRYRGCQGRSQHQSLGNHDFAANGDHIYPYLPLKVNR